MGAMKGSISFSKSRTGRGKESEDFFPVEMMLVIYANYTSLSPAILEVKDFKNL